MRDIVNRIVSAPNGQNGEMARIALVRHNPEVPAGRMAQSLARHDVVEVWATAGDFPSDVDGAVVLGGFMGAYEVARYPWLRSEKAWLAELVRRDIPVLGICLGAQLLADSLGGRAFCAPRPEVGVLDLVLTGDGAVHPVASRLGPRGFFSHQDTFELPPHATLLAATADYPAVFEMGAALAIQHHPEARYEHVASWVTHPRYRHLEVLGISAEDFLAEVADHAAEADASASELFTRWFERFSE